MNLVPEAKKEVTQFYRRPLPSSCIDFTSSDGKLIFTESLQAGYMEGFFKLSSQYRTQDEPAYCGLTSLVIALNALEIDPGKIWKGPWRWYHEDMLDCCTPLQVAKEKGINLDQFECLATCNSLQAYMAKASNFTVDELRDQIKRAVRRDDVVFIASYSRKVLGQTGDGHFSPIAGYNDGRDLALVFDTARFKYPPHWVSVDLLYKAMLSIDKDTGKCRGFVVLSKEIGTSDSLLFKLAPFLSVGVDKGCIPAPLANFAVQWKKWLILTRPSTDILENHENIVHVALAQLLAMVSQGQLSIPTLSLRMFCRNARCVIEKDRACKMIFCLPSQDEKPETVNSGHFIDNRSDIAPHHNEGKVSDLKARNEGNAERPKNDVEGEGVSKKENVDIGVCADHKVLCAVKVLIDELESLKTFSVVKAHFASLTNEEKMKFLDIILHDQNSTDLSLIPSLLSTVSQSQSVVAENGQNSDASCCAKKRRTEGDANMSFRTAESPIIDTDKFVFDGSEFRFKEVLIRIHPEHLATVFLYAWPHAFPVVFEEETAQSVTGVTNDTAEPHVRAGVVGLEKNYPESDSSHTDIGIALVDHLSLDLQKSNSKFLKGELEALNKKFKYVFQYHGLHKAKKCFCKKT